MVATTDQKARMFDLTATVWELVRTGKRDFNDVSRALQIIKDDPRFSERVPRASSTVPVLRGWVLEEDVKDPDPEQVFVRGLHLRQLLHQNEPVISDHEMLSRAKAWECSFGQRHAEWLVEHPQGLLPYELITPQYPILFPGTVWRKKEERAVPCVEQDNSAQWFLSLFKLNGIWAGYHCRFVHVLSQ